MPGWTEENFGNDGARQFLEMQAARLVTTIHDIIGSKDRIAPDDDGESMLMPCVEVLALLCERYDVPPPKVATVQTWHKAYLAAFDAGFDALKRLDVILAVGRDDPLLSCNRRLSELLWQKGVWHALRIWDGFAHDWPVWAQMLPRYLGGHD